MTTVTTPWDKDLTAPAIKAATAKAESINGHVTKGNKEFGAAAMDLELVYRHYLKGDKARLVAFAGSLLEPGIKASMAYVYVQAGRVLRNPEACGLSAAEAPGMAVQALAQFDGFIKADPSEQAEATAEALTFVKANREQAEAAGTKALTAEGLRETRKALREADPEAEAPADPIDRKVGNIAAKLRDSLPQAMLAAEGVRIKEGDAAGWYWFAEWVADNCLQGPLTGQAINRLAAAAKAEAKKAAAAEAKAKALADRLAEAVAVLSPEAKAKETAEVIAAVNKRQAERAKVTEAPTKAPVKRSNRKPRNTGTAALVKVNGPADGK